MHLTVADKSRSFFILDKVEYLDKMSHLLSDNEPYEPLTKNAIDQVNSQC